MPTKDRLHGMLDLLVLRTLQLGPRHGYGIARWLEGRSGNVLEIEDGSLYPALYRMEKRGLIAAEWGTSELGRRAKFYRLTAAGRRYLRSESAEWRRFMAAVSAVLAPVGT